MMIIIMKMIMIHDYMNNDDNDDNDDANNAENDKIR